MLDLRTKFMGIELKNPIIVGACELTSNMEKIKEIEEAGAGAIIIKSLFEEQIQLESLKFEEDLHKYDDLHAEMITIFPNLKHAGPAEHLMWVKKAKNSVKIPVFASLNAVSKDTWIEYAKQLEQTEVDGLELNFYTVPETFDKSASKIEEEQIDVIREIKATISLPISVKLSTFYSNPLNIISKLDQENVQAFVLFNQLLQPDIDVNQEKNIFPFNLSDEKDHRLPLRFAGLLYGNINGDICANTGILKGLDIVKMLLAGANCVQIVSTLYKNKIDYITTMLQEIKKWMKQKGYSSLNDFRGKLSHKNSEDPWAYKRAQYVKMLLKSSPLD